MKADELLKKMTVAKLQYGWYDYNNDKIITPEDKEFLIPNYFENNCYVLKPEEVWKRKIGTCWEYMLLTYTELSKTYKNIFPIYFEIHKPDLLITHATVVYQEPKNNAWYWFEYSWTPYFGINGPYTESTARFEPLRFAQERYNAHDHQVPCLNTDIDVNKILKLDHITANDFINIAQTSVKATKWLNKFAEVSRK